jgi:hypothetical protein
MKAIYEKLTLAIIFKSEMVLGKLDAHTRALVTHTCNPSYSGGRDQEDLGSRPAQANSLRDLISKKTLHKKGLVEWLKV